MSEVETPEFKAAQAYWTACDARYWDVYGSLLADDIVYEVPQTRERVRGREAYVQFNREFPGDWHVEIIKIVAAPGNAVTWTAFHLDGKTDTGIAFLEFDAAGKVVKVTDFWPDPYEPPANRAHLAERY